MQLKIGNDRIVILLPLLGIAIKLPFIRIIRFLRNSYRDLRRGHFREACEWPIELPGGPKNLLFKGLVDNWREYRFYRKTKHPFLQPTLCSLFGLVNVQRLGKPCEVTMTDHWAQLYDISGGKSFCDPHHLSNPANFCFDGNKLRILDYGSPKVQDFLITFGQDIQEKYDPSFVRNYPATEAKT